MKRIGLILVILGVLSVLAFALSDYLGPEGSGQIGAAQILGIDIGALLFFTGIGFVVIRRDRPTSLAAWARTLPGRILDLPLAVWIISPFLLVYTAFFIAPVFLSSLKIKYFVKYIPYEWITNIGNDIQWTVDHIILWMTQGQSPFSSFFYPPLTVLVFAPFILLGYPGYYRVMALFILLSYIASALLVPVLVSPKKNHALPLLFFAVGLVSYGLQFELERGQFNLVSFTSCLLAVYIFHYRPGLRYIAYLLFSFSIQLKMYPIIFIFMFIENWRDWKANIARMFGLGLFNLSLLFVLGYQVFVDFTRNLASAQVEFQSSRREDLSIKGFVYNLTTDGFGLFQQPVLDRLARYSGWIETGFLALFAICLFSILLYAYLRDQKGLNIYLLTVCTIGALIIPSASVDYKLPLLVAPFAITLANLPDIQVRSRKMISIILILLASTAYWSTQFPFTVRPYLISRNFPALVVILVSTTILFFLVAGKSQIRPVPGQDPLEA